MAKPKKDATDDSHVYGTQRREREVRATRRLMMGIMIPLYIVVLIASATALHEHYQDVARLAREGRTVAAFVTGRSRSREHPGDYYVDYVFSTPSRQIDGYQKVSQRDYQRTRIGGTVTITYLPADPKLQDWGVVSEEKVRADRNSSFVAMGFLTFFFALSIGLIWLCLPRIHQSRRVFKG